MILIADSGSTKTTWQGIHTKGATTQAQTVGVNPYYQNTEEIIHTLTSELLPQLPPEAPQAVYYYGAGCSAKDKKAVVANALAALFPRAEIQVNSDLEGAARALCGHEEGIACILGTGSNSCLYDGEKIVQNIPNLGFILGDEGSGGHLGKTLIQAFLNQELPQDLHSAFMDRYNTSRDEIVDNVYRKPYPNRYMATFAKFLFDHREHAYIHQMISGCFADFLKKTVLKYPDYHSKKTHFVGSVAFHFKEILLTVAQKYNITVYQTVENPIAGLSLYHQQQIAL